MARLVFIFLFLTSVCLGAVENSVIPVMEKFEQIENLPEQKFTKNQFSEISAALSHSDEKIRLVTYNMLFDLYDHDLEEVNRWPQRMPRVVELVRSMQADIVNTQELYPSQFEDLSAALEEFTFFAGQKVSGGESYGIFYRTDRFELISEEVNYPLATVQLKDIKTGKEVYVYNTHMPFSNMEQRETNARLIAEVLEPLAQDNALVFTGDLNTFPGMLEMDKFPFYDGDYIQRILSQGSLKNSQSVSLLGHFGPLSTFTNTGTETSPFQGTGTPGVFLDHVFVSPKVQVLTHGVECGTVEGHYPSDHMPVVVDFLVK